MYIEDLWTFLGRKYDFHEFLWHLDACTTNLIAAQQYLRDSICEQTYQPFAKILLPQLTSDHHFSTHPALISSYFNRGAVALLQSQF